MTTFEIRPATTADIPQLESIAVQMKAHHEAGYFARCLQEQADGARGLFIAVAPGQAAQGGYAQGYAQLIWSPVYAPFRRLNIPEIQDVCVVPDARRQGLGEALVRYCEAAARRAGRTDIGLGVGLHAGFGAAQRLYVRLGYMPDGFGAVYDEITVPAGEMRAVDDLLSIKLTRIL